MKKKKKIQERDRWDITPEEQRRLMEKSALSNFHYEEDEGSAGKATPVHQIQYNNGKKKDHTTGFYVVHTIGDVDKLYTDLKQGDIVMTMKPNVKMLLMLNPSEKSYKVFHESPVIQEPEPVPEKPNYEIRYELNRLLNILTITDSVSSYSFDLNNAFDIELSLSSVTIEMLDQYKRKILDFIKINLFPSMILKVSDTNSVFEDVLENHKVIGNQIMVTRYNEYMYIHVFAPKFDMMIDEIRFASITMSNTNYLKVLVYIAQTIDKMNVFGRYTGFDEYTCDNYLTKDMQTRIKNFVGYNLSETTYNSDDIFVLLNSQNASQIYLSGESLISGLCDSEEDDEDDEEPLISKKLKELGEIEDDEDDDDSVFDAFDEMNDSEPVQSSSNKDDSSESFVVPLVRKGR